MYNYLFFQDPAIASNKTLQSNYPALDVGMNRDIFVKVNNTYLEGKVIFFSLKYVFMHKFIIILLLLKTIS